MTARITVNGGKRLICGLDEAGCGPLAGPVVAGCVILGEDFDCSILNDSKKMTAKRRAEAQAIIKRDALWGLGVVDEKTIDRINILQSRLLAMRLAFDQMISKLPERPGLCPQQFAQIVHEDGTNRNDEITAAMEEIEAIADGTYCPQLPCPVRCEVKADGKYPAVMAASIIAKEERDSIMLKMDVLYPQYGYARHKGYPTREHRRILQELGPSPIQRMTFKWH